MRCLPIWRACTTLRVFSHYIWFILVYCTCTTDTLNSFVEQFKIYYSLILFFFRACLHLITDCPPAVQEELDLISALSQLEDFNVNILPLQGLYLRRHWFCLSVRFNDSLIVPYISNIWRVWDCFSSLMFILLFQSHSTQLFTYWE